MRQLMLAMLLAASLITGPLAPPAAAVTVEELFNLKANGLSDDILVALIESDGSVFRLLPEDVLALSRRGLSERVILAMIATSRRSVQVTLDPVVPIVPPAPVPQTVIQPVQITNSPSVEVYVPVAVPVAVVVPNRRHEPDRVEKPVYWGFGRQLRPDAWRPATDPDRKTEHKADTPPARRR